MEKGIIIILFYYGLKMLLVKRKGPLVPITQNMNKTRYIRFLKRYLFPVID